MSPAVSFLIATYNRAGYLDRCLESIFSQTRRDFEIIVVDDSSTDGTEELIRGKYAGRVIYHRHYINHGVAFARNVALDYARGKYIGLLDSDDILYSPKYLEIALGILEAHPDIAMFSCDTFCIDAAGNRIGERTFLQTTIDYAGVQLRSKVMDFEDLFFYGLHSCGALVKRESIRDVGFLDISYKIAWDEDFFLRLSAHKPKAVYYHNEPLTGYRIHTGNISNNSSRLYLERIKCHRDILRKNNTLRKALGLRVNRRLAELNLCLIDAYLKERKINAAGATIFKTVCLYPLILPRLFKHGLSFLKGSVA